MNIATSKQPGEANRPGKGIALCITPEEGTSYWQPLPSTGYATVMVSPFTAPSNHLSAGIQVLEPGRWVRNHAHERNEEMLFVYEGTGTGVVDGKTYKLAPGSLIMVGRHVEHTLINEGTTQMKIFWVFTPPGLECWFEAIGRARQPGEPMPAPFPRPDNVGDTQKSLFFVKPDKLQYDNMAPPAAPVPAAE